MLVCLFRLIYKLVCNIVSCERGQSQARGFHASAHATSRRYSVDYRRLNNLLDPDVRAEIVTESESEYLRVS